MNVERTVQECLKYSTSLLRFTRLSRVLSTYHDHALSQDKVHGQTHSESTSVSLPRADAYTVWKTVEIYTFAFGFWIVLKTRKQKCAVVLAVSTLAAAIIVAGYFVVESLRLSQVHQLMR